MPKPLQLCEIDEILASRGLRLKDDRYTNSKTKMHCIDADGYEYSLTLDCIKDKRTVAFAKYSQHNPYTINNLQVFIQQNHLRCELLTKENPQNEKQKLEFKCACGKHYWLHYNHLLITKKDTCNKCGYAQGTKFTPEYISTIIEPLGYKLLSINNADTISICVEDECGYKYKTMLHNILDGCAPIKFHKLNPYTVENMKLFATLHNYPIQIQEPNNKRIEVRTEYLNCSCAECGEVYQATWQQLTHDYRFRCEKCCARQSNLAYTVEQYLLQKQVEYCKEYRFTDCRNTRALPFDFYLPKYNCAIEVQGDQHYYENDMFAQSLEDRQRVDKIKQTYCEANGIQYIAIPRWWIQNIHEKKRYKEVIDNIINQS